jgi:hypothetical protein
VKDFMHHEKLPAFSRRLQQILFGLATKTQRIAADPNFDGYWHSGVQVIYFSPAFIAGGTNAQAPG